MLTKISEPLDVKPKALEDGEEISHTDWTTSHFELCPLLDHRLWAHTYLLLNSSMTYHLSAVISRRLLFCLT